MYTLKTTKHCWKKWTIKINGKIVSVHGSDDLMLLKWQYLLRWSTNSMWSKITAGFFAEIDNWQADTKIDGNVRDQGIPHS